MAKEVKANKVKERARAELPGKLPSQETKLSKQAMAKAAKAVGGKETAVGKAVKAAVGRTHPAIIGTSDRTTRLSNPIRGL